MIEKHELFPYIFDAAPMFVALLLLNILHPGKILVGAESEFPKKTKAEKKAAKEQKKAAKAEKKEAQKARKNRGTEKDMYQSV